MRYHFHVVEVEGQKAEVFQKQNIIKIKNLKKKNLFCILGPMRGKIKALGIEGTPNE